MVFIDLPAVVMSHGMKENLVNIMHIIAILFQSLETSGDS